jgi:2-keto-4-pentenoate hydratase
MSSTDLAQALWQARQEGMAITLDEAAAPSSLAAAYGVQAAVVAHSGLRQVGWKIGASTPETMALLAVDAPFVGPLLKPHCHANGAAVALPMAQGPGLEAEFLIGLAADLPSCPEPYQRDEVAAAVGFVAPAFEIVGSRIDGGIAGRGRLAIADGGANVAIVQGPRVDHWQRLDLAGETVRLRVNGEEVASGKSADLVFGDPIGAVLWLANLRLLAGHGLRAGDLVMTGTCTGVTPLQPGDEAIADFGELGQVRASFT